MNNHEQQIERALSLLTTERLPWKTVASHLCISPFYFQRLFKRYTGVSPKQYVAYLTLADIKQRLAAGDSILGAGYTAGLSGSGRTHDLFVTIEAMTPGEFRRLGENITIEYGTALSPFGRLFIAATKRGICQLHFLQQDGDTERSLKKLRRQWQSATLIQSDRRAALLATKIFTDADTPLHVRGTNFQINVWRALLMLPTGTVISYGRLARDITGKTQSARAVGAAVGANPVAVIIPCHRVLNGNGDLTGYAWGLGKKRMLLTREFAVAADANTPG